MVFVLMGNGLTPFYRKSRSMRIHFQALGLFSNRRAQLADSPEVRIDSFPSLFEAAFPSTDFHAFQSVRFPNTFLKLIFLPASRFTEEIGTFLKNTLKLDLHPNRRIIRPVSNGIDFVGYIVRPSHLYIRKRVVEKCKTAITDQTKGMMKRRNDCVSMVFMPGACHKLYCTLNSYFGAFSHASCHRLVQTIFTKNLPLRTMFKNKEFKVIKRWSPPFRSANLYTQYRFFRARFRGLLLFQVGCYLEMYDKDALWAVKHLGMKRIFPRKGFYARCGISMKRLKAFSKKLAGQHAMYVFQTGRMHGRILERVAVRMDYCDKSMKKANNQ